MIAVTVESGGEVATVRVAATGGGKLVMETRCQSGAREAGTEVECEEELACTRRERTGGCEEAIEFICATTGNMQSCRLLLRRLWSEVYMQRIHSDSCYVLL